MSTNKIAKRIKLLLAKAESTSSESEAEALRDKAAELIFKYQISTSQLDADDPKDLARDVIQYKFKGVYSKVKARMIGCFARGLGAFPLYHSLSRPAEWWTDVYVYKCDRDHITAFIDSLINQADIALASWWAKNRRQFHPRDATNAKRDFLEEFGSIVEYRLDNLTREVAQTSGSTDLVLIDRAQRLRAAVLDGQEIGTIRANRRDSIYSAVSAGRQAAMQADIGQSNIEKDIHKTPISPI